LRNDRPTELPGMRLALSSDSRRKPMADWQLGNGKMA